jgi:hypothetical protein
LSVLMKSRVPPSSNELAARSNAATLDRFNSERKAGVTWGRLNLSSPRTDLQIPDAEDDVPEQPATATETISPAMSGRMVPTIWQPNVVCCLVLGGVLDQAIKRMSPAVVTLNPHDSR